MESLIKLTVKTPNQRIDDIEIDCDLKWNVRNLKEYLQDVYPSNPESGSQKLIYLGRLLQDHLSLKEVFGDWGNKTLHIVCPEPTNSQPTQTVISPPANERLSHDSLRQRRPASTTTSINTPFTVPNQQQTPTFIPTTTAFNPTTPTSLAGLTYQQQQEYQMQMQQYYQQFQQWQQLMMQSSSQWPYNQMPMFQQANTPSTPNTPQSPAPSSPGVQPAGVNNRPAEAAPPADDNVPMNAGPGPLQDDGGNGRNRDWLDWVYMSMRALMLMSIVYFYSSTSRFLMVSLLGFLVYLYQAGWFTPQRVQQAPTPTPEDVAQQENNEDADNIQNNDQENTDQADSSTNSNIVNPKPPSVGVFRLMWTFCAAFVGSLIPTAAVRPVEP